MRLHEISDERLQDYLHRAGARVDSRMTRMAQARNRLNKGYEIYHADRPAGGSQIVDRFDADTPALARQYYEKFIRDYVSDVDYDLRLRRATGIMEWSLGKTPKDHGQAHRSGVDLEAWKDNLEFQINATAHGRDLGRVLFDIQFQGNDTILVAKDLMILPEYRGQGIAAIMYDYAKELGYQVERSREQTDAGKAFWDKNRGDQRVWESDLAEIAKIPQGDFGDADTLTAPAYDIDKKPLPGGGKFTYAVGRPDAEDLEIMIFDGETLAAELDLFYTQDVTKAWRVSTVAVNPDYRGRGLGKALYGIALSILKLTIEAGDTQTKHGQRMWLMLNSIPGVEVVGYNMERTPEYKSRPGDKIIAQDDTWTRYTFPVKPGTHSMRSSRRGTGMYTSQASMIARWTGR